MKKNQLITVNDVAITEQDFMQGIDNVLIQLHDTGDITYAANVLNGLDKVDNVAGHAKSKLLWGMNEWHKVNKPNEDFGDYVESVSTTKAITAHRYISVWNHIENLDIPKEIHSRPMRELVPIAKTLDQGYDIGKDGWRKINQCANDGELRDVLRKIKGKSERKSARVIKLDRKGSLWGWKDNKKYFLGYLNIEEAQKDIVIAEFIEKIKISSGIVEE